jgi:hypothetical protein
VCSEDGVDPLTRKKCAAGEYFCTCGGWERTRECSDLRARVGRGAGSTTILLLFEFRESLGDTARWLLKGAGFQLLPPARVADVNFSLKIGVNIAAASLRRENITDVWASFTRFLDWDYFMKAPYMTWQNNIYLKTGGYWYSTFQEGECAYDNDNDRCTWRVR